MRPTPDHGEESHRGTGRLLGRKAVITGADSGIGRAVAIAFAREGADVVLSYLPAEESDAKKVVGLIEQAGRKAVAVPGDAFSKALAQQVAAGGIRVNVVAPGPVWTPLQVAGGQPTDKLPEFGSESPIGRPAQPAELAAAYFFSRVKSRVTSAAQRSM